MSKRKNKKKKNVDDNYFFPLPLMNCVGATCSKDIEYFAFKALYKIMKERDSDEQKK